MRPENTPWTPDVRLTNRYIASQTRSAYIHEDKETPDRCRLRQQAQTERTEEEELADQEYDEGGEDDRHSAGVDARQQGLQGGTDTAPDHDGCAAINHIEHEPVKHGAMNRQSVWLRNGPIEPKTSPSLVSQVPDNDLDDDIPPLITPEPSEDGDSANAQDGSDAGVPDLDLPYTVSSVFSQVFRLFNDDQVAGNFCTMFGGSDPGPKYPRHQTLNQTMVGTASARRKFHSRHRYSLQPSSSPPRISEFVIFEDDAGSSIVPLHREDHDGMMTCLYIFVEELPKVLFVHGFLC
ncbi:hypothetical protein B0H14DRAFT_3530453 [Mycena olivaceomarginata]|nr:hypothetical protein B0H14DRAFT_3530453 [Mycena olivaceomarginata]